MRASVNFKRAGAKLATIVSVVAALFMMAAGTAAAADTTETFDDSVTFIGDSVTAGFGYCGTENAKNISCKVNGEMADRWYFGDNSLSDCAPKDPPALPNDACSNNNYNGKPWTQGAWQPGPDAPNVAYPYQLAAGQPQKNAAEVSDWAVTGSTPANWDPKSGDFGDQLDRLSHQYVVMTLGANPLLSYFTNIEFHNYLIDDVRGPCVGSTGYYERSWIFAKTWYSGPISKPINCLRQEWGRLNQTEHLVHIYNSLLAQGDGVIVLGYYRDCSWSFGNWQPSANASGPAAGNSCKGELRPTSSDDSTRISQWDQAVAVGNELNDLIHDAVEKARDAARHQWPGSGRAGNIVFTSPDPQQWENHQPKSPDGSWVLLQDTWIHPNRNGAENLAKTVQRAMCGSFGHWCGDAQGWE